MVLLRTAAPSPVAKHRLGTNEMSDALLGKRRVNKKILFCNAYFAAGAQVAWLTQVVRLINRIIILPKGGLHTL